ncbi:MAG TPA: hypothetical protein VLX58_15585 [Bryobacteraceae bacterium]|nr:hypothetical protein [Bryobacteraceae bacterium]
MTSSIVFGVGLCGAVVLCFLVVWYLKSHLRGLLIDLCGTETRADFWMAFSNVVLILVPLMFGMQFHTETDRELPIVFQITYQLKWVLSGLVVSVLTLGAVLSLFIRRHSAKPAGQ